MVARVQSRRRGGEQGLRRACARVCRTLYDRFLVEGAGGNVSARIRGTDHILITPSGISLGLVRPLDLIVVDMAGRTLQAPRGMIPSTELPLHVATYRTRPDVGAIIHAHPPFATAFACRGQSLPLPAITGRVLLSEVPCIPYATSGTEDLGRVAGAALRRYQQSRGFLLRNHGILVVGDSVDVALDLADLVECTAKTAFLVQQLNG